MEMSSSTYASVKIPGTIKYVSSNTSEYEQHITISTRDGDNTEDLTIRLNKKNPRCG